MNEAGIIATIIGTAVVVLSAIVGIAWRAGLFKGEAVAVDGAANVAINEMRQHIQQLTSQVNHLVVQGAKNEQDIRNLQELRREMLATLDKIFDSLSRGQRP